MNTSNNTYESVDAYIAAFPQEVGSRLQTIRKTVQEIAPEAVESISYGMPAFKLNGKPLVYFSGFKKHIGFYATPSGHDAFVEELSLYKQGKGSVQFPHDKPLPKELIKRIVIFRKEQNETPIKK